MIVEWSCTTWSRIGVWGGEGVVGCRLVHGCFCIVLPYHWDKDVKFTFRHLEVRTPVAFFFSSAFVYTAELLSWRGCPSSVHKSRLVCAIGS